MGEGGGPISRTDDDDDKLDIDVMHIFWNSEHRRIRSTVKEPIVLSLIAIND